MFICSQCLFRHGIGLKDVLGENIKDLVTAWLEGVAYTAPAIPHSMAEDEEHNLITPSISDGCEHSQDISMDTESSFDGGSILLQVTLKSEHLRSRAQHRGQAKRR
jgi:glycerol kinase